LIFSNKISKRFYDILSILEICENSIDIFEKFIGLGIPEILFFKKIVFFIRDIA